MESLSVLCSKYIQKNICVILKLPVCLKGLFEKISHPCLFAKRVMYSDVLQYEAMCVFILENDINISNSEIKWKYSQNVRNWCNLESINLKIKNPDSGAHVMKYHTDDIFSMHNKIFYSKKRDLFAHVDISFALQYQESENKYIIKYGDTGEDYYAGLNVPRIILSDFTSAQIKYLLENKIISNPQIGYNSD